RRLQPPLRHLVRARRADRRSVLPVAMTHDQAAAFALDALDPDESTAFEEHLAGCPRCEDELEPLRFVAAALAFAGELPQPRATLRIRVLDVGAPVFMLRRRVSTPVVAAAAVAAVWVILLAALIPAQHHGASGLVVVSPGREAVLMVRHLDDAPAGATYEA